MNLKLYWPIIAFGLGFDIVACMMFGFFSPEGSRVSNAFLLFGCALGLSFALWLYKFIKNWAYFFLIGKRYMKRSYLRVLKSTDMPNPNGEFDMDEYLATVFDIQNLSKQEKSALSLAAELNAIKMNETSKFLQAQMAASAALTEYDMTFVRYREERTRPNND